MAQVIGDVDELVTVIARTSEQAALNVEAEAQRRAEQLVAEAHAAADAVRAEILGAAEKQAAEIKRRLQAQNELSAQQQRLAAREALFDAVWAECEQQLQALPQQPGYLAVLQRLALAAAQQLGDGPITLVADPQGHALLAGPVLAEWSDAAQVTFTRAEAPGKHGGGLLALHADGRRQVDATWATRLELARTLLREQVATALEVI